MTGREATRAPITQAQDPLLRLRRSDSDEEAQLATGPPAREDDTLQSLALKGRWKEIAQRTAAFREGGSEAMLQEAAWHILALNKTRDYTAAAEELKSLGDLESPDYLKDTPHGAQSRVPFALRLLACDLPGRLGHWREAQDASYALLEYCRQNGGQKLSAADSALQASFEAVWAEREERVIASLFCQHLRLRDYRTALQWLEWLRKRHPNSLELLSTVGCVQLVVGHVSAAAATFQAVSSQVERKAEEDQHQQLLVRRNRGLLKFAQNDYQGSAAEFDAVACASPQDFVAVNNRAIARMYGGDLTSAVQSLESSLRDQPQAMLREAVLANLGSMYELSSPASSQAAKKNLSAWATRTAPDDFDFACLR